MAGYEFDPQRGMVPIGVERKGASTDVVPGGAMLAALQAQSGTGPQARPQQLPLPGAAPHTGDQSKKTVARKPSDMAGLGPREVLKQAKLRIRELKKELKRHEELKAELAELERLVAAAKAKPRAPLRAVDKALDA